MNKPTIDSNLIPTGDPSQVQFAYKQAPSQVSAGVEPEQQFTFGEIFAKRWKIAALSTLAALVVAALYLALDPRSYESDATLYIEPPSHYSSSPSSFMDSQSGGAAALLGMNQGADIQSQMLIIQSDDNLTEVMHRLGINENLETFRNQVKLTVDKDSPSFVDISARGKSPEQAQAIAATLVDVYHEYLDRDDSTDVGRSAIIVRQQLVKNAGQLSRDEDQLVAYSHKSGVIAPDAQDQQEVTSLATMTQDLVTAQAKLNGDQGQVDYFGKVINGLPATTTPTVTYASNPLLQEQNQHLADLEVDRAKLATMYTSKDPEMIQNQNQIDGVKREIASDYQDGQKIAGDASDTGMTPPDRSGGYIVSTATKAVNPIREDARGEAIKANADAQVEQAQVSALTGAISQVTSQLSSVPASTRRYLDLKQAVDVDQEIQRALYLELADLEPRRGSEEIRLQYGENPNLPQKTASPKPLYAALLVFGGLIVGLIAMIRSHSVDPTIRGISDIPATLSLPILATVPRLEASAMSRSGADRIDPGPTFRQLAIQLGYMGVGRVIKSILVTSPGAGSGVSLVASKLALAFSQEGKRVILVDANVRNPALHTLFNTSNTDGFSSVMRNGGNPDKALMPLGDQRALEFIPSGPLEGGAGLADLLDSAKLEMVLNALEQRCDIVIIDSPSIFDGLSSATLAEHVDASIVVAAINHGSREEAERGVSLLSRSRASLLGAVVNTGVAN